MAQVIPLTPVKKKPRYRAVVIDRHTNDWHERLRKGWSEHRVHVYAGGHEISTMIRRVG